MSPEDQVLIVDDFWPMDKRKGLIDIIQQAGAQVIGVGIIIEKSFQDGRQLLIDAGVPVTSLARIEKFQDGQVVFAPADI